MRVSLLSAMPPWQSQLSGSFDHLLHSEYCFFVEYSIEGRYSLVVEYEKFRD
jgi:hypothetical protein